VGHGTFGDHGLGDRGTRETNLDVSVNGSQGRDDRDARSDYHDHDRCRVLSGTIRSGQFDTRLDLSEYVVSVLLVIKVDGRYLIG
jgi:hypothetical protein